MVMELVTTDKLERLKSICSEKLERIKILQDVFLENEAFLAKERNSVLPTSALNSLKLSLIQYHVKLAQLTESIEVEEKKKQRFLHSIERLTALKEEATMDLQKLSTLIAPYKKEVSSFSRDIDVFVTQLQEGYLMMIEEKRSWMTQDQEISVKDNKSECLTKLISAAQIQRQQAEKVLAEYEKQFQDLTKQQAQD